MTAGHVLVVEDDVGVASLLRELLGQEGYAVDVAGDGLTGLLRLRTTDVDAVLLDVMMPAVDGTRVLAQLTEEHGGALPVPVIVVTGSPDAARTCRGYLGADDVFEKPFDPIALLARLRTRLAGEEATG